MALENLLRALEQEEDSLHMAGEQEKYQYARRIRREAEDAARKVLMPKVPDLPTLFLDNDQGELFNAQESLPDQL